jgi:hypothetical protein
MNKHIKALLVEAEFCLWEDEEWKPQENSVIDWSSDHTEEFEVFLLLLRNKIFDLIDVPGTPVAAIVNINNLFGVEQ